VTGSAGFVGGWLLAHLKESGDQAIGLDMEVDITNGPALSSALEAAAPETICHLAALTSVGSSWSEATETFRVNALGTLQLLQAAVGLNPRPRVLLVSSAEVYGIVGAEALPLSEDQPFAPVSPYAASKAASEMIGLQAWLGQGLEVVRARPFNHTGPGQRPGFVVPALARQVAQAAREGAASLMAGNLDVRRDITDVRDVVRAYRQLLVQGAAGEVYNVCSGRSVLLAEVARSLLNLAGLELPIEVDPARMRPVDLPELRGDPARLRQATGWQSQIPLDDTLRDVLAYWQANP